MGRRSSGTDFALFLRTLFFAIENDLALWSSDLVGKGEGDDGQAVRIMISTVPWTMAPKTGRETSTVSVVLFVRPPAPACMRKAFHDQSTASTPPSKPETCTALVGGVAKDGGKQARLTPLVVRRVSGLLVSGLRAARRDRRHRMNRSMRMCCRPPADENEIAKKKKQPFSLCVSLLALAISLLSSVPFI